MNSISGSILQEPIDFVVTSNRQGFWKRKEKRFMIYPLCLGTLLLIAKELIQFEEFKPADKGLDFDSVIKGIIGNSALLSKVISLALWNKRFSNNKIIRYFQYKHLKNLAEYIEGNLDSGEILVLSNAVIKQMEIEHFLACMGSIRGMEIVKDQEEPRDSKKETCGE